MTSDTGDDFDPQNAPRFGGGRSAPIFTKLVAPTRNIPAPPKQPPRTRPTRRLPTKMEFSAVSPTEQYGEIGKDVASPPRVRVFDFAGYPVVGVTVAFTITTPGSSIGTPTPGGGPITGYSARTTGNGEAAVPSWKLLAGHEHVMTATITLPNNEPQTVTFRAIVKG